MHPRRKGDGLALPWLALPLARIVVRSFDVGERIGAGARTLAQEATVLAVLGTSEDEAVDRLAAGPALERALLEATPAGPQASHLNKPVQVAALRPNLADLCATTAHPQIHLRMGYPEDRIPAAPRRRLSDMVERRDG